ncbi:VOC family protein [Sphingomonas pokkalii]|uniref:Glyoxalase/fosfomycin resistance/dioxygenase domain-containing protein n=1 Tax=Sphingomonas pokkalii TaxID=2175090 RepID=A0A2U0SH80_9SPHN|nr:VOC family protein [Sphingomonas pokkalii]PVX30698.1 hypothetical protein DD559_16260 [Sphingomonas pokkalii]
MNAPTHGTILGGLVTVPDLDAALADYQGRLGLMLVEQGVLAGDLAGSWGCPASAGARMATLQPASGAPCCIRLVEAPVPDGYLPMRSYGWAAYELTVQDVFSLPDRLAGSGFEVIGPPKSIASMPFFVPMQVFGSGGEMLYLNEVAADMPNCDLPKAKSPTDHIFVAVLAAPDRLASVRWYAETLDLDIVDTHVLPYTMINKAFGLPADHMTTITVVQKGRLPIVEIDGFPAETVARPCRPGALPPGNALVTLAVRDLAALDLAGIAAPVVREGPLYAGRRAMTLRGPTGELVELVEIG